MRLRTSSIAALTLATAGSVAVASPALHRHRHVHGDKRIVKVVDVAGPTVFAYELNGELIGQSEVCEGIKAGTLKWAEGTESPPACSTSIEQDLQFSQSTPIKADSSTGQTSKVGFDTPSSQPVISSVVEGTSATSSTLSIQVTFPATTGILSISPTTSSLPATLAEIGNENTRVQTTPTSAGKPSSSQPSALVTSSTHASSSQSSGTPGGQGLDAEFPDGEIDCTTFPSDYGPIDVEWANLGGWSGIQYVTIEENTVIHIDTAVPGGDGCKPGAMCSYACPPGYQKSQWPTAQGSTGQSVGGLSCDSNGKLTLTNPGLSKKLCIQGTGGVTVQNKLSNNAAICRTDYPGTEDETVPLNAEPDSTSPLTCPDASTYFQHDGDPTSAQYYVNNQGVALQSACIWGRDGTDEGNWAPSYFGVGQDTNGKIWLSIASTAQNNPSSYTPLNYTVKITGDISGKCGLSNGQYCSGENYDDCNTQGCTVELLSGEATYVLENSPSLAD